MMKIFVFGGDLTDISAKTEALVVHWAYLVCRDSVRLYMGINSIAITIKVDFFAADNRPNELHFVGQLIQQQRFPVHKSLRSVLLFSKLNKMFFWIL